MKSFRNAPCSAGSHGSLVVKNVKTFGSVKNRICILSEKQKKNVLDLKKNWIWIWLIYLAIYFYKPDSTSQRDKYMFDSESKNKKSDQNIKG